MKEQTIVLVLAGVAVFLVVQAGKLRAGTVPPPTGSAPPTGTKKAAPKKTGAVLEVLDNGKPYANGWRYFDDGTAIGPDGSYYYQGGMVYTPANGGASGSW